MKLFALFYTLIGKKKSLRALTPKLKLETTSIIPLYLIFFISSIIFIDISSYIVNIKIIF